MIFSRSGAENIDRIHRQIGQPILSNQKCLEAEAGEHKNKANCFRRKNRYSMLLTTRKRFSS